MKIAIVSASIGHGHNAVALALQDFLTKEGPDNEVEVFDILDDNMGYQFLKKVYIEMIKSTPHVYSKLFHWSHKYDKCSSVVSYLDFLCLRILKKIKGSYKPDIFIFTHPFPAKGYIDALKIPAWTVITDYGYHPFWYNPKMTGYFVGNAEIKKQICKKGYPKKQVMVTGIPIKKDFYREHLVQDLREENGIKKIPLILIMGGGLGLGCLKEVMESLEELKIPFKAVVLTGKNRELFRFMNYSIKDKTPERWQVLPFTDDIPSFMKKASLLISKAGAVTLTEAGTAGLPTIIYKPIPGHEEVNARFVCDKGWAIWAKGTEELKEITANLLGAGTDLEKMKMKCYAFNKSMGGKKIAKRIVRNVSHSVRRSF